MGALSTKAVVNETQGWPSKKDAITGDEYTQASLQRAAAAVAPSEAWCELIEERYNLCMLFYCVCKQAAESAEDGEESRYGVINSSIWIMEHFSELLCVPRYTLMKSIPYSGPATKLDFHPTIHEGKLYSRSGRDIRVTNFSDTLITTLEGHTGKVTCLAVICTGKLYSGSDDSTIKVWNCSTNKLITTLDEHTDTILCFKIHFGKLYSASKDTTVNVWSCVDDSLIASLRGHTCAVDCLSIHPEGMLYSGSGYGDSVIKVWNCSNNKLITTLRGHTSYIWCLTTNDDKLYSGSGYGDNTIRVWNCRDNQLVATLEGHTGAPVVLIIHDDKLYSGSRDHTIKIWDCSTDTFITTLEGHTRPISDLSFQNGNLISMQDGGTIKIWQL